MKIKSSATVLLETPSGRPIHIRVSTASDVPPCPDCGGKEEAVLILVEPDQAPKDEHSVLIYPCGFGDPSNTQCCRARGKT